MPNQQTPGMHGILLALILLAVAFFLSLRALRPPAPVPASAPATDFSAGRAREVLRTMLGNGVPHPVGSAADDAVRERIVAELTRIGYTPEIQSGFVCDEIGICASVKNIVARLDGSVPGQSVLVSAHYDSVPAGPGASDDGVGVACVLEIARAMKARQQPTHSVIFLINEGEEAGLLGARVFVESDLSAKEIRAAVNIDNRGTSGPSSMFETGTANDWAVRIFAQHATRPSTSSISYSVYKRLPNDTDFTVYKAVGYQGLNFAFIGGVAHYHTPLDNFDNANPASIQHHGDNALPSVVALANADLSNIPSGEAVYFDLLGRWLISWPARAGLPLSIVALLLILLEAAWLLWQKNLTSAALVWGLAGWLVTLAGAAGGAYLLAWFLRKAGAFPVSWVAYPLPAEAAFWTLSLAAVAFVGIVISRRAGFAGFWAGVWIWWALAAVLLSRLEPGFSYIFLVPSAVAALAGLPMALWPHPPDDAARHGSTLASVAPLTVAAILVFPAAIQFYDALGTKLLATIGLIIALALTPFAPLLDGLKSARPFPRLVFLSAIIAVPALAIFGAIVAPAYSAQSPERLNLRYWLDADAGAGQWMALPASGRLPEPLRVATQFHRSDKGPFPWSSAPVFLADAPHLVLNAPTFTILESSVDGSVRSYRALLRSERGALNALVMFPPDSGIAASHVEGVAVSAPSQGIRRYFNGWTLFECVTMPAKGVELTFTLPAGKPVDVYVVDQSFELPLEGMFLRKARPLTAIPSQDGDGTVVTRRVQILP